MKLCYRFPVVKGKQADNEYYIGMIPLNMLGNLFKNDEEYVLPEYRAQRRLNETRIPEIKKYILNNKKSYIFSALTASIDGEFEFISSNVDDVGILEISLNAKFLINDGQHRKAAILAALEEDDSIGEETISVVFFADKGLSRSQQMFTDLNKHAVKTSNSISELYDSRDRLAVVTRKTVNSVIFFKEYVDMEKDMLGKFSSSLFTLNTIYNANKRIVGKNEINESIENFLIKYWNNVTAHIIPWNELRNKLLSKVELREKYIVSQSIIIQAFGKLGSYLLTNKKYNNIKYYKNLEDINWKRSNSEWKLRVIRENGRMINNEKASLLAMILIKKKIGLPLLDEEKREEKQFKINIKNLK